MYGLYIAIHINCKQSRYHFTLLFNVVAYNLPINKHLRGLTKFNYYLSHSYIGKFEQSL